MAKIVYAATASQCPGALNTQPGWYVNETWVAPTYANPATGAPYSPQELAAMVGGTSTPTGEAAAPAAELPATLEGGLTVSDPYSSAAVQEMMAAGTFPSGGVLWGTEGAPPLAQLLGGAGPGAMPPAGDLGDMSPYFEAGEMLTAPMSEYEQQALQMLSDLAGQLGGMVSPYETPMGETVGSALTSLLSGEFPEEYFQASIAGPARKTFEELTAPAIREEFVEPGTFWGTDRMKAVTKGRTDMESVLAAIRGDLGYKAQQMALQAVGPGMEYMGLPTDQLIKQIAGVSAYMGAGALPRLIEQHGLDIAYQEFIRTRPENQPYAQMLMSLLNIPMMASYAPEEPESPWASILELAGTLIPIFAG